MNLPADGALACGARVRIRGCVQGVGFRPHVHALARRYGLRGFVVNDGDGVLLEVEGHDLEAFLDELCARAPAAARIDSVTRQALATGDRSPGFAILPSRGVGHGLATVPPDLGICEACVHELFDADDRRHLHPFIACTACGPRLTMARALPYDRARTSMAAFALCDGCRHEYEAPDDRLIKTKDFTLPLKRP